MQRDPIPVLLVCLASGEVSNQNHIGAFAQLQDTEQFSGGDQRKAVCPRARAEQQWLGEPSIGWYNSALPPLRTTMRTRAFAVRGKATMLNVLVSGEAREQLARC